MGFLSAFKHELCGKRSAKNIKRCKSFLPQEENIVFTKRSKPTIDYSMMDDTGFSELSMNSSQINNEDGKTIQDQANASQVSSQTQKQADASQASSQTQANASQASSQTQANASQASIKTAGSLKSKLNMDWKDEVIWECHTLGNKPNAIMKIINRFILVTGLPKDFISADAIRTRIKKIYKNISAAHDERKGYKYLLAVAHESPPTKHGHVISSSIMSVLQKTNSTETLNIIAMDGCNTNTGVRSKISFYYFHFRFFTIL